MVFDSRLLGITALVTVVYQASFFAVTYLCRFDTLTDFAGSTNFIVVAALTLALGSRPLKARAIVLSTLVFVWGARLCAFLLARILAWGEDRRFDDKRNNVARLAVFWTLQAVWVWTVSLPVTLLNATPYNPTLHATDFVGWALFAAGLALESIADAQKTRYKKTPESKGRWTDVGTWAWSRHPNYAGEIVLWWGAYVSAVRALRGAEHLAVLGPIFITCILLFVSGIPLLEQGANKKHGAKAEYREYLSKTSILWPIPPKLYVSLPQWVKRYILLDLPLYAKGLDEVSDNGQAQAQAPTTAATEGDQLQAGADV